VLGCSCCVFVCGTCFSSHRLLPVRCRDGAGPLLQAYIYIYISLSIIYIHTYVPLSLYLSMYTYMYLSIYIYICVPMFALFLGYCMYGAATELVLYFKEKHIYTYICTSRSVYIYVYIYIDLHISRVNLCFKDIYIYIYICTSLSIYLSLPTCFYQYLSMSIYRVEG